MRNIRFLAVENPDLHDKNVKYSWFRSIEGS